MSALPPIATGERTSWIGSSVPEADFTLASEDRGNKCPDLAPAKSGANPGHKGYPDFAPLSPSYGRLSKQFMARHSIQRSADRTKPTHDFAHALGMSVNPVA